MTPNHAPSPPPNRAHILTLARTWLGTPYHHQASVRGAGCDCVGLVRGVYRALYGHDAETTAPYTRDWAEATGEETLIAAARRHLIEIDATAAQPGDILIFRYRPHMIAKHTAILSHVPLSPLAGNTRALPAETSVQKENPRLQPGTQSHLEPSQRLNIVPLPSGEGAGVGRSNNRDSRVLIHGTAIRPKVTLSACGEGVPLHRPSRPRPHPTPDPSPEGRGDRVATLSNQVSHSREAPERSEPISLALEAFAPATTAYTSTLTLIHALEGAPVSEVPFHPWWQRRIAAAFSFPGITD